MNDEALRGGMSLGSVVAGRYRLDAVLGRGGMGTVYLAFDEQLEEPVALKSLHPVGGPEDEEHLSALRREVRAARRVTHPNVARIHDLGAHGAVPFLTMEAIDGAHLRAVFRLGLPLAPEVAAALVAPAAEGVAAAHDAGVLHRDLKPSNVLVDVSGRVVVTDFGLARTFDEQSLSTSAGAGTLLYMAPEQVSGGRLAPPCDVYALGLMLYEALLGVLPFHRPTSFASAVARVTEPPPNPRRQGRELPEPLAVLLERVLDRQPDRRPSAREFAAALRDAVEPATPDVVGALARDSKEDRATEAGSRGSRSSRAEGHWTLAVLPFRCRTDPELGMEVAERVTDLLASTRGVSVVAAGAIGGLSMGDAPGLGGAGVDAVVEGTVRPLGDGGWSAQVRLADPHSGLRLWNDRAESVGTDLAEIEERLAKRVAETLRLGLQTATFSEHAPPAALQPYLRARRRLTELQFHGSDGAVADLEACLAIAPTFAPALAAHAIACVRAWFIPGLSDRDWEAEARASVARALERAPELAETQLAAAMLSAQDGEHARSAAALQAALDVAPTFAEAHEYLGRLLAEAGHTRAGLRHLRTALDLDASLHRCLLDVARTCSLLGQPAQTRTAIRELEQRAGAESLLAYQARLREAAWRGDEETLGRDGARLAELGPAHRIAVDYARGLRREVDVEDVLDGWRGLRDGSGNARFRAFVGQLGAELAAARGEREAAHAFIERAVEDGLVDLLWLDRCPLLEPLWGDPRHAHARATVAARAQAVIEAR